MDAMNLEDARSELALVLSDAEAYLGTIKAAEIRMLIDAGEYGVAVEHLASYVVENDVPVAADMAIRLQRVASDLGMQSDEAVRAVALRGSAQSEQSR